MSLKNINTRRKFILVFCAYKTFQCFVIAKFRIVMIRGFGVAYVLLCITS